MELSRYKAEMVKAKRQKDALKDRLSRLDQREQEIEQSHASMEGIGEFCALITEGLTSMTFDEQRELLQTVVESVTVYDGHVRVEGLLPIGRMPERCSGELRTHRPEPVEGRRVTLDTLFSRANAATPPYGVTLRLV